MMAAAQHVRELLPFSLAQLDPISYIHRRPPTIEGKTDESWIRAGSRVATALHAQARGSIWHSSMPICWCSVGRRPKPTYGATFESLHLQFIRCWSHSNAKASSDASQVSRAA